ncbi:MAG: hypothetical protein Q9171_007106 [Xanthocarpia ochracea]
MAATERAVEKTFGPSPESMLPKSKLPNKRQKRAPAKVTSHSLAISEDSFDDSDTLFIPPKGNSRAQPEDVVRDTSTIEPSTTGSASKASTPRKPSAELLSTGYTSTRVAPATIIPRDEPAKLADSATKPAATRKPAVKPKRPSKMPKRASNILDNLGNFPGLLSTEEASTSVTDEEQQDTESPDIVRAETPSTRPKPQQPSFARKPRKSSINKQIEVALPFLAYVGLKRANPRILDQFNNGQTLYRITSKARLVRKYLPYNLEPEDLVEDYLTAFRKHLEAVLQLSLPLVASSTPVEYIITVPVTWSNLAVRRTRTCAEKAGMGEASSLQIVPEPEAAAIWALREQEHISGTFTIGDIFIVCDAGGGTVDLITYRVTKLKPILGVTEVVAGCGKKCGSTFLNRAFEALLRSKLESFASWDEDMLGDAMKRFDLETKRQFDGSKTKDYLIPVPGFPDVLNDPECYIRNTRFSLKGADLYNIFEPIVQDVLGLVRQQIEATKRAELSVKAILLVGGFGENSYLHKRLCASVSSENIEVYKPAHGWTTVVRGALLHGLAKHSPKDAEVAVVGRCAGVHYGTASAKEFDENEHPIAQRFQSAANSRYEVNTYDWFIAKVRLACFKRDRRGLLTEIDIQGQTISENKPLRLSYHTESAASRKKLDSITITIVRCVDSEDKGPPLFVGGELTTAFAESTPASPDQILTG